MLRKKLLLITLLIVGCEDEDCVTPMWLGGGGYVQHSAELYLSNCVGGSGKYDCIDRIGSEIRVSSGSEKAGVDSVLYFIDGIFVKKTEIEPFSHEWGQPDFDYGEYKFKAHIYLTLHCKETSATIIDSIIVNLKQEEDN